MGYNKQLNDSYRVVYTDTGSTALPDISNFSHTGVYSLIAKPSQLGTAVSIGFSVVSGGKVSNTTLAEGNYFVEYSDLTTAKYWNFSFLGKASSGSEFTAQNTMVTYDKSKGTYTISTDALSGGSDVPTPAVYITKTVDVPLVASTNGKDATLTGYVLSDNKIIVIGSLDNTATTKDSNSWFAATYTYSNIVPSQIFVGGGRVNTSVKGYFFGMYNTQYKIGTSTYGSNTIYIYYKGATTSETKTATYSTDVLIYGTYSGD